LEKEIGKEMWIMLKQTSGWFELIGQNMYILVAAHFYTIIFFAVKDLVIEND